MKALFVTSCILALACAVPVGDQLIADCSGQFVCTNDGAHEGYVMSLGSGGECTVGAYVLHADGTVTTVPSVTPETGTWSATDWRSDNKIFDMSAGNDRYHCSLGLLVTCLTTFTATSDCTDTPDVKDTSCQDNVPRENCVSDSWSNDGAYCDTLNASEATAFTSETCATLGY